MFYMFYTCYMLSICVYILFPAPWCGIAIVTWVRTYRDSVGFGVVGKSCQFNLTTVMMYAIGYHAQIWDLYLRRRLCPGGGRSRVWATVGDTSRPSHCV